MAYGYMGNGAAKVLFVDLKAKKTDFELFDDSILEKYLGGYGLAAKIMFDRQKAGVDPLGPENMLGFFSGSLGGTGALVASRFMVVGKSPLTGTWGDANGGGKFGPNLKFAGYDGVFFSGISEKPVYLLIENGNVEIKDATDLWGKDTYETDDHLRGIHGQESCVACIGPASEKLSLISGISTDKGRFAARSGLGAVMGSKNLKAVVVKGTLDVPMADEDRVNQLRKKYKPKDKEFTKYGTAKETASYTEAGECPAKNWSEAGVTSFPEAEKITGDEIIQFQTKKYTCYKCQIACGAILEVKESPFATEAPTHKPQYESLGSFGVLTLNNDPESMVRLNEICNRAGLDTISAGGVVAFAIECFENSIITKKDTGGLELSWGDAGTMVELLKLICKREKIGDILADGVKKASEIIGKGSEKFAIHIAGQEPSMHDPKNTPGLALTYLLDATPGRHSQGGELLTPPGLQVENFENTNYHGRAKSHRKLVNVLHVANACGYCMLAYFFVDINVMPQFLNAVTGWDKTMEEYLTIGERIHTIRHAFNIREGYNPLEQKYSPRIFGDKPLEKGPTKGMTVDVKTMLNEYLAEMGWDEKTTKPSKESLLALGMVDVSEALN